MDRSDGGDAREPVAVVPDDDAECALCGRRPGDDTWFALDVQRPAWTTTGVRAPTPDHLDVVFCSQRHAARWLARTIPPTVVLPPDVGPPSPARDRLALVALGVVLALGAAVLGIGLWTVGTWVLAVF